MLSHWTVAKKLTWGLTLILAMTAVAGAIAIRALYAQQKNSEHALSLGREITHACELLSDTHARAGDLQTYLLSKDEQALVDARARERDFQEKLVQKAARRRRQRDRRGKTGRPRSLSVRATRR